MDPRRNYAQDPDADSRWHPDDRGHDDRGYGDREHEERGYQPRRADDRDYDDSSYRVPDPRRAYGDAPGYGDPYGDRPASGSPYGAQGGGPLPVADPLGPVAPPVADPLGPPPSSGGPYGGAPGSGAPYGASPGGAPVTVSQPVGTPLAPVAQPFAPPAAPLAADPLTSTGELLGENVGRPRRTEAFDRTALQRPVPATGAGPAGPAGPAVEPGGSVYRSKRPGLAVILGVLTVLFEVPVLRLFLTAATADRIDGPGTIASIFMILGLPTFALGLYGLISGAAAAAPGVRAWLRTPLAYLPVALLLFLAAGLAG